MGRGELTVVLGLSVTVSRLPQKSLSTFSGSVWFARVPVEMHPKVELSEGTRKEALMYTTVTILPH